MWIAGIYEPRSPVPRAKANPVRHTSLLATSLVVALAACGSSTTSAPASSTAEPAANATGADSSGASASALPSATPAELAAAATLVGATAPEWRAERWLNSPPLSLASLRGSVVLVRWWTAGCPFCSATAPSLRAFDRTYRDRGLKVIGMYHHKENTPFDPKVYEDTARKYEFAFPIAFDPEWHTLESWLHDAQGKEVSTGWTSITFVLDKKGVIRHVHPGGKYVEGEPAYDELRGVIERLLTET